MLCALWWFNWRCLKLGGVGGGWRKVGGWKLIWKRGTGSPCSTGQLPPMVSPSTSGIKHTISNYFMVLLILDR